MKGSRPASFHRRATVSLFLAAMLTIGLAGAVIAHPLGNFTINHFARLEIGDTQIHIRYVVDMAEIPTLQELQTMNESADGSPTSAELNAYLERIVLKYADGIRLTVDGTRIPLQPFARTISLPRGDGGLPTLRVECDLAGEVTAKVRSAPRRLHFEDTNHTNRIGWHEIVIVPTTGTSVFNSSSFTDGLSNELRAYPQDRISAPLDERVATLSFTQGEAPAGATLLRTRDNSGASTAEVSPGTQTREQRAEPARVVTAAPQSGETRAQNSPRDPLADLIAVPEITPAIALFGLLLAAALGAVHAFSPGHGKTVVGAYLVGSRGTARHAAFLGATVTITHTLGVFALGLITLFASQYIVPERLFPILSLISGGIVFMIGMSLFLRRVREAVGYPAHAHSHGDHALHIHTEHSFDHHTHDAHDHHHDAHHGLHVHSHGGGRPHSHLPPGADGVPVTWRNLLALGISGGLLPCPSALVVLLSAIALHRTGYGLLLVIAFSLGLAATLTAVGLTFVYAGRLMKRSAESSRFSNRFGQLARVVPAASAFVVMCVGVAICYEALIQVEVVTLTALRLGELFTSSASEANTISTASVLVFGFGLGLKHAVEADHLAAVSTIVSERKSLLSSSLVGGLWGIGHTISLFVVGVIVILLHVEISERTAQALEFGVAIMLVALGVNALIKIVSGKLHTHPHEHGDHSHTHPHLHDGAPEIDPRAHHGYRIGKRPLLIGMVHGLAGSAALMLLVLSTISAPFVGLLYIIIFGIGSIGGMMLMSTLVGLPIHLTAKSFAGANIAMRGLAGLFSLCFGLFMVYEIGVAGNLFR